MRLKISFLLVSLLCAIIFVSGGYGYWQKELTIEGNITVVEPNANNDATPLEQIKAPVRSNIPINSPEQPKNQLPQITPSNTAREHAIIKSAEEAKDIIEANEVTETTEVDPLANKEISKDKLEEVK